MSNIFDEKGHLSIIALKALKSGTLSEIELLSALTHIGECENCANVYADNFSLDELQEVPFGFEEEVKNKMKPIRVKNKQFIYYSLRVSVAACITLAIVFSGVMNLITNIDARAFNKSTDLSTVNSINTNLKGFSEKILNMEVLKNEKEKK